MDQYAVVGHPISHSKSPKIHAEFASQTGQQLEYTAIQAPLDGFVHTVKEFFSHGGKGLNITVPFKEQAWSLCDSRSADAELAGAVNTLYLDEKKQLCGDNTDGKGLLRDLMVNHKVSIEGKRVLVLGAGGAVRGILQPLLAANPCEVVIANRTVAKADALVDLFTSAGAVSASEFAKLNGTFDVIINGTSASLSGDLPPLPQGLVSNQTVAYDMMYGAQMTVFNQWAQEQGACQAIDGLGMLVEQAAEAFMCWRGVRPETSTVLDNLRNS